MTRFRVCILLTCMACSGDRQATPVAETGIPVVKTSPPLVTTGTGWLLAAGPVLIAPVPGTRGEIMFVLPDEIDTRATQPASFDIDQIIDGEIDLFGPMGFLGKARINDESASDIDCGQWPTGRTRELPHARWRVGLARSKAAAIAADSIGNVTFEARELLRLAARTTADSGFAGIPFNFRSAYRFPAPDGTLLIGEAARQINTEANVRVQRIMLLAVRKSKSSDFRLAYSLSSSGTEASVLAFDFLAALSFTTEPQPILVVTVESEAGTRFGILKVNETGVWTMTWRSSRSTCS